MGQSQRVAKNIVVMMGSQFLTWVFALVAMVLVPRYFGVTAYGEWGTAAITIALCSTINGLSGSMVITKDVARDPACVGDYILGMLPLRIALAVLTAIGAIGAAHLLHFSPLTRQFIYVFLVPWLWGPIADGFVAILRGQENFARQSLSTVVEKILGTVLTLVMVFVKAPLWSIGAIGIFSSLVGFGIVLGAFRHVPLPRFSRRHLGLSRYMLTAGLPYFSAGLFGTVYGSADTAIIKWLDGYTAVGWYGVVRKLFGTALFIPTTVTAAMLPMLSRMYHERPDAFGPVVRRMNTLNMICAAPIAVVLIFAPRPLVTLMESRHHIGEFHGAMPLFVLFGFALIFWFLSQSLGTALIASDRQAIFGKTTAVACALCVPLCVPLTYLTKRVFNNGAIGASIASILVEVVLLAFYIRALPPDIFTRDSVKHLSKIALASVPMGLTVLALSDKIGLFSLIPGIFVYALCGWALKVVSPEDLEMLRQIVRRKTGVQETAAALQAAEDMSGGMASEADILPSPNADMTARQFGLRRKAFFAETKDLRLTGRAKARGRKQEKERELVAPR